MKSLALPSMSRVLFYGDSMEDEGRFIRPRSLKLKYTKTARALEYLSYQI